MEDQTAYLNGIKLNIRDIVDESEPAVIAHEFPLSNGAKLANQGVKAVRITFTAFFIEDNFDDHIKLKNELGKRELAEFIHPTYGLRKGMVSLFVVSRNDRKRTAEVNITFVEDIITTQNPVFIPDVVGETGQQFGGGVLQLTGQQIDNITEMLPDIGAEASDIASRALDEDLGIIEKFADLTGPVREYVKTIDSAVTTITGTLSAITNPANSLIASIAFAENLPGRLIQSISLAAERYIELYEDIRSAPEDFVDNFHDSMDGLKKTLGIDEASRAGSARGGTNRQVAQETARDHIAQNIDAVGALTVSTELGEIYAEDNEKRRVVTSSEREDSFDAQGNFIGNADIEEIFTVDEIEHSLASAREYLQAAIDNDNRGISALFGMANALLQDVNRVKLEIEKIITVTEHNTIPLFLIMQKNNQPYNRVDRILALNPDIVNPNFVSGEVRLYA